MVTSRTAAEEQLERLLEGIRDSGMRVTLARRVICRVLAEASDDYLTADEILDKVADVAPGVHKATVDRTLSALWSIGLVNHIHPGNEVGYYHLSDMDGHLHLVCRHCGRVTSAEPEGLSDAIFQAGEDEGFTINSSNLVLLGICEACSD